MHPHARTLFFISLLGLLCGAFAGTGAYLINQAEKMDGSGTRNQLEIETPQVQAHSPTPEKDFCIDVPVLTYHHIQPFEIADPKNQRELTVTPENFTWHMRTLKEKGYRFIMLEELVDALRTKTPFEDKVIAITFDDGYRDAYRYAFPIAKQYDVAMNIGIITGLTGNPEHLTVSQMKEMYASGLASFHNHSWSHMNFAKLPQTSIEKQILTAQEHLEEWTDSRSAIVYYPYGVYGEVAQEVLATQHFDAAFELSLSRRSTQQCLSEIYGLPRLRMGNAGPEAYGL